MKIPSNRKPASDWASPMPVQHFTSNGISTGNESVLIFMKIMMAGDID